MEERKGREYTHWVRLNFPLLFWECTVTEPTEQSSMGYSWRS